jgi:hypothetical protein
MACNWFKEPQYYIFLYLFVIEVENTGNSVLESFRTLLREYLWPAYPTAVYVYTFVTFKRI